MHGGVISFSKGGGSTVGQVEEKGLDIRTGYREGRETF